LIFLDMDGVLTNFTAGALEAHGADDPWADPANLGNFDMAGMLGLSNNRFYAPLESHRFWAGLKPTRDAKEIVSVVKEFCPVENTYLLTSPTRSDGCWSGKHAWVVEWMPGYRSRLIVGKDKHLMAGPGRILIDDKDENCQRWIGAGGSAVLFPRPWNGRHAEEEGFDLRKELGELT
jgi:5'(3')-deoxyribonucleotidase